jgi:ribose transport system substrate-binding protein
MMLNLAKPCLAKSCLAALLLLAVSCGRSGKPIVGVVPKGANHIFWQTVHAGAVKASREFGFEVEWNAPTLEIDSSRQIEIVESMINRRVAGIALAPVDRKALAGVVERAAKAGIPVAIFDSALDSDKPVSYVATDNREGGRMAARRLAEVIGQAGKVAVIGFMPGSAATMEREEGFAEEIKAKFPAIQIVAMQFGMASQAKSMAATENVLSAHPDLKGVFADNESSSMGAVQALKSRQARQVKMVAFDASEALVKDLREGWIDALVVQDPFKMGYESARAIGQKLRGEAPLAKLDSGARLILSQQLDDEATRSFLFPDLKPWLGDRTPGH